MRRLHDAAGVSAATEPAAADAAPEPARGPSTRRAAAGSCSSSGRSCSWRSRRGSARRRSRRCSRPSGTPTGLDLPLLTVAVQLGFAAGAIVLALTGAADVVNGPRLIAAGAVVTALANLGFAAFATDAASALPWRALTGAGLAAVYPVALKMLSGWFRPAPRSRDRRPDRGADGRVGAAAPAPGRRRDRRRDVAADGRRREPRSRSSPAAIVAGRRTRRARSRSPRRGSARPPPRARSASRRSGSRPRATSATCGSSTRCGRGCRCSSRRRSRPPARRIRRPPPRPRSSSSRAAASAASSPARWPTDRGRTTLTIAAMAVSGGTALVIGFLFGAAPAVITAVAVVWGVTVIADSAQFSTAVSELSPPGTAGSALSLQLAAGFILTGVTILGVGLARPGRRLRLAGRLGAPRPRTGRGIAAMWRLRGRPDATKMANGHR